MKKGSNEPRQPFSYRGSMLSPQIFLPVTVLFSASVAIRPDIHEFERILFVVEVAAR